MFSIPVVDRASLGPTSLIGVVMKVISDGSAFMIGTKHGILSTPLSYSDISPSNTTLPLHPEQVPDAHLSVRTTAQLNIVGVPTQLL